MQEVCFLFKIEFLDQKIDMIQIKNCKGGGGGEGAFEKPFMGISRQKEWKI